MAWPCGAPAPTRAMKLGKPSPPRATPARGRKVVNATIETPVAPLAIHDPPLLDRERSERVKHSTTASTSGRAQHPPPHPVEHQPNFPLTATHTAHALPRTPADLDHMLSHSPPSRAPESSESRVFLESLRMNTRILQSVTLAELNDIVREELDAMLACGLGGVNMSTAVYRTAFMWRQLTEAAQKKGAFPTAAAAQRHLYQQHDRLVRPVFDTLAAPIMRKYGERTNAFDIAITLWSCAVVGYRNDALLRALTNLGVSVLEDFQCMDCAHVMWACGTLDYRSAPLLMEEVAVVALRKIEDFKPKELSNFVWGMGRLNVRDRAFLAAAVQRLALRCGDFSIQEAVNLVHGLGRLGWQDDGVLEPALRSLHARLDDFVPQDFSNLLWALARVRAALQPPLLDDVADAAIPQLSSFKPQELSNFAYGYGMLMHNHETLMEALAKQTCSMKKVMSDQELCVVLWALGKLHYRPEEYILDEIAGEFCTRIRRLPPLTLSNIFKAYAKLDFVPRNDLLEHVAKASHDRIKLFGMAELANLLWACAQLDFYDAALCRAAEKHVCETLHECSWHHVSSMVNSLRQLRYPAQQLVSSARSYGFQV